MAKDPILAANLVRGRCFEVGGEFSPASIRDQMVRGYLVVDRAYEAGLIGPPETGLDLLVIGAGPSGVTTAVRGAELGVRTLLIEKRKRQPFRMAGCRTRYIEPTLYDWALAHWSQDLFEWTGAPMPLQWRADWADLIALRWRADVARFLARPKSGFPLTIEYGATPILGSSKAPFRTTPSGVVSVGIRKWGGAAVPKSFGAVVSCVGLGREDVAARPHYRGFEFWKTDKFARPDCGLPSPPRILISGGGDGGLQDFIRVMTRQDTGGVFDTLVAALSPAPEVMESIASDIQDAEDVAARALSWASLPRHDRAIFERLETAHEMAIDDLQKSTLWRAVEGTIKRLLPSPLPDVKLAHRGRHFTRCYPLNRFISLLILRIADSSGRIRSRNTTIDEVNCSHPRPHSAKGCHGQTHTVKYKIDTVPHVDDFEVVILRHGITGPKSLFKWSGPAQPRQLLPYFVER